MDQRWGCGCLLTDDEFIRLPFGEAEKIWWARWQLLTFDIFDIDMDQIRGHPERNEGSRSNAMVICILSLKPIHWILQPKAAGTWISHPCFCIGQFPASLQGTELVNDPKLRRYLGHQRAKHIAAKAAQLQTCHLWPWINHEVSRSLEGSVLYKATRRMCLWIEYYD